MRVGCEALSSLGGKNTKVEEATYILPSILPLPNKTEVYGSSPHHEFYHFLQSRGYKDLGQYLDPTIDVHRNPTKRLYDIS